MKGIIYLLCLLVCLPARSQDMPVKYMSTGEARSKFPDRIRQNSFLVFPDDRDVPAQWADSLKSKWLEAAFDPEHFSIQARPGEYFVFQTGIWSVQENLENVTAVFSVLKSKTGNLIRPGETSCFNTGGVDYQGHSFSKKLSIKRDEVRALWMGIQVPAAAKGDYYGQLIVSARVAEKQSSFKSVIKKINIRVTVSGEQLAGHGFEDGSRLSRMAWLNSTVGINTRVPRKFIAVSRSQNTLAIAGRSLQIAGDGLPGKIATYFSASNQTLQKKGEPLLNQPFHFVIEKTNGEHLHLKPGKLSFVRRSPSAISWRVISSSDEADLLCEGELQFDGFASYRLRLRAKKKLDIRDIRLESLLNSDKAIYMMGLNKAGGIRPDSWQWKWDTTRNQDALWLGSVNGGLRIKWKAENYRLPLVNIYYAFGPLNLPPSWAMPVRAV